MSLMPPYQALRSETCPPFEAHEISEAAFYAAWAISDHQEGRNSEHTPRLGQLKDLLVEKATWLKDISAERTYGTGLLEDPLVRSIIDFYHKPTSNRMYDNLTISEVAKEISIGFEMVADELAKLETHPEKIKKSDLEPIRNYCFDVSSYLRPYAAPMKEYGNR